MSVVAYANVSWLRYSLLSHMPRLLLYHPTFPLGFQWPQRCFHITCPLSVRPNATYLDGPAEWCALILTLTQCVALRVPAHAPWLARRSLVHRVTRMTCHAPVRTGGAVGAGWDLD